MTHQSRPGIGIYTNNGVQDGQPRRPVEEHSVKSIAMEMIAVGLPDDSVERYGHDIVCGDVV